MFIQWCGTPTVVAPTRDPDRQIHPVSIIAPSLLCNVTMWYSNALNWAVNVPQSLINLVLAPIEPSNPTNVGSDQYNIAEAQRIGNSHYDYDKIS